MKSYISTAVFLVLFSITISKATPYSNPYFNYNQRCQNSACRGRRIPRVVGGAITSPENHPWLVKLLRNGKQKCGGSLITRRHVLTAAHCVHNRRIEDFSIELGDYRRHEIRTIGEHADYNRYISHENDIAIIELQWEVEFNRYVRTICLPQPNKEYAGTFGVAAGYGKIRQDYDSGREIPLQAVTLPILGMSDCAYTYYNPRVLTDKIICAGYKEGGKDTCQGDSGGPLESRDRQGVVLIGIVSWGTGCAQESYPGIYTKVSKYIRWIQTWTENESLCF